MSLDIAHVTPEEVFYVDDRPNLVSAAESLSIRGVVNKSFADMKQKLLEVL